MFPSSGMTAKDVIETGIKNVVIATGSHYRRDGIGRSVHSPINGHDNANVWTPDDIMDEKKLSGKVVIYDDDHFYMAGVLAEKLTAAGCEVSIVTPAPLISYWTQFTLEQEKIEKKLLAMGVKFYARYTLTEIFDHAVTIKCTITGKSTSLDRDDVLLVTDRKPNDSLYHELRPYLENNRLESLRVIGDAEAPGTIAQAVYAGHLAAREFEETINPDVTPFLVERITDMSIT
jgi:dimethylamine/trimethylamine dehydrogenase